MKNSTDVWYIAFLISKGFEIKNYQIVNKGKVNCYFEIDDEAWKKIKLEFHSSEISKFKAIIEKIKDLAY